MIINNQSALKIMLNNIAAIVTAILIAFGLSACSVSSTSQTDNAVSNASDPMNYQDCAYPPKALIAACQMQGGEFSQQGMLGCYSCIISYDDAEKSCQDSADCQGVCESVGEFVASGVVNQTGQCSADSSPFGCRQTIENDVAGSAICVD